MTKKEKLFYFLTNVVSLVVLFVAPLFEVYYEKTTMKGDLNIIHKGGYEYYFTQTYASLFALLAFCIICYAFTATKKSEASRATGVAIALLVTGNLIYMVSGIIQVQSSLEYYENLQVKGVAYKIETYAYFSFAIAMAELVIYAVLQHLLMSKDSKEVCYKEAPIVVEYKAPAKVRRVEAKQPETVMVNAKSLEETSAMLLKYKDLLDQGAISQEEYDEIKSKLLK